MTLKKIITVLDADFWEARENFGRLFYNQLDAANLILLNKVDLIDERKDPAISEGNPRGDPRHPGGADHPLCRRSGNPLEPRPRPRVSVSSRFEFFRPDRY